MDMITGEGGISSFIHRFIPAQSAQISPGPTLLMLHGTGGDENALLDLGRMLAPGAALLSPRGKILENGMPRYFRRLAEGVFDLSDLTRRTHELADFVETASVAYDFDPARVIAVGFSNGANIAGSMLLLRPSVLSAAVLLHAQVPLVPPSLPNLLGKPIFIGAGPADPCERDRAPCRAAATGRRDGHNVLAQRRPRGQPRRGERGARVARAADREPGSRIKISRSY